MTTFGRFYNWLTSWGLSSRRKVSITSTCQTTTSSNSSNVSLYETHTVSALKGDKLTSSNIKKAVRFAEMQNGKVLAEVMNKNERPPLDKGVRPLDEALEEVYIKGGVIRGFIQVKNLEPGREVLIRYTEDNWKGFKQVIPKRVERITHSNGKQQIRLVKQRHKKLLRRQKQIKPNTTDKTPQTTYFLEIAVEQTKLNQVEVVIISSLNNVIDTNHQQCYLFKCVRRSWEENEPPSSSQPPWNVNESGISRQS